MRNTHRDMPMHHIEKWTGSFFRAACLWEVGNYILVPHYSSTGRLCKELEFQKTSLEEYQQEKDQAEQTVLSNAASGSASAALNAAHEWADLSAIGTVDDEGESEAMNVEELDEDFDDDIQASAGYLDDHPPPNSPTQTSADSFQMPQYAWESEPGNPQNHWHSAARTVVPQDAADGTDHPGRDSLNNAYVRVIHLNGVHHLALVNCTCLSGDEIHANLLSCCLVPTTFTRYRTLFTAGVLDDFRISNLECKVSAYQYYHKLRRLTSPAAPTTVPSFYHELLRLSRLWRWMKKLKWAGYGHKTGDPSSPQSGELANFCPACPQPGVNLPSDWKDDPNR